MIQLWHIYRHENSYEYIIPTEEISDGYFTYTRVNNVRAAEITQQAMASTELGSEVIGSANLQEVLKTIFKDYRRSYEII